MLSININESLDLIPFLRLLSIKAHIFFYCFCSNVYFENIFFQFLQRDVNHSFGNYKT